MFLELSKSPMVAINPFPLVKDISPIKRILIVGFRFFPSFFNRGWNSVWNRYGIDVFSISVPHENPLFSRLFQLFSGTEQMEQM